MKDAKWQLKVVHMSKPHDFHGTIEKIDVDITESFADEIDEILELVRKEPKKAQEMLQKISNDLRDPE